MKHYTFTLLTLLVSTFLFSGCLDAKTPQYSLYDDCNEYYDSQGNYFRTCKNEKFDLKKAKKAYKMLTGEIEPGTGPEEENTTKPSKLASTIDDIIEDKSPEDPTSKENQKDKDSETPAIPERPALEFGREGAN